MPNQVTTVRVYLATPAGARRRRALMIGKGLSYQRALCVIASEALRTDRAETLTAVVRAIVNAIPRIAA